MKFKLYILLFFLIYVGYAQERAYVNTTKKGTEVKIQVTDGIYYFKAYSNKIIETTFVPKKQKRIAGSHAVVLNTKQHLKVKEKTNTIILNTKGVKVKIKKNPLTISYYYKDKLLISERKGYQKLKNEVLDFAISNNEILYGGGARALGMNRRGYRLQLYNRAHYGYETHSELMNYTLPLFFSSNKYGVHFDNAPIGYLDLDSKKDNSIQYETISGAKRYQVIAGDTWEDIVNEYTNLTGKQPMLPRWALENFSSRFGYHSQKETENTIAKFKEEKIPVDAVILDLYWFGKGIKGTMGNLEVYKDSFPNMSKMIKNFKEKGVNTILITEPFVLTTSKKWDEAVAKNILAKDSISSPAHYDFYFGDTGIVDIYNPKGSTWFKNIYKRLLQMGATGMWGDLGEPEVLPSWVNFTNGTADEIHNIYGHDWAKLVYETFKENLPNERPFILMRAGYSDSQHYGIIPWSGDVNRTWGGLQSQSEIALQMGMQGLGYMHSDLGGFAGANLDDELYVRWLQYGVFQPIYRPHAQEEVASEPVFRSEKTKQLAKKAIELRYKLLPYNYHLVFKNSLSGTPLMRPLFFQEPNNKEYQNIASTYLWGNHFLITPITKPKQKQVKVYFPKNSYWFNFYTDEVISGGKSLNVFTKEATIPTYVRAGAFIPMIAKPIQTTEEYNNHEIELHYYHHKSVIRSEDNLYLDDGKTSNTYKKSLYELVNFKSSSTVKKLKFKFSSKIGLNYSFKPKKIHLVIHGLFQKPEWIKVDKKKKMAIWDAVTKQFKVKLNWNTIALKKIKIKY